jgi:hypothetical protein
MPNPCRSPRPIRKFKLSSWLVFGAGFWLLACGGGDQVQVPERADAGNEQAQVNSGVNVCPVFAGSLVMPQRIGPGQKSNIAVRATDPDAPDSELIFAWSAASGSFSASDKPMTSYRCADSGSQRLTFTATDRIGCVSSLNIDVECVAD